MYGELESSGAVRTASYRRPTSTSSPGWCPTPPPPFVGDAGYLPQVERLNDTWKAVGGFLRCLDPAPALS
ncbi:hypothetical protein [Allorhizocola rhizosphaerae]|uniref:hypothetical protein n=1 Tax=Allorhizocola rhizosphaerae TaxID=1872709 RepID=UPI0013C35B64|nr:hypothetical protein [Allorhizocola rhizosphaerae]